MQSVAVALLVFTACGPPPKPVSSPAPESKEPASTSDEQPAAPQQTLLGKVTPNEPVSFRVTPLRQRAIPRRASLFLILAAAGFAAWFLIGPTLRAGDFEADVADTSPLTRERETVTQSILDLDNDFETGKVSADDHARMRAELRARALELLRQERETPARAAERAAARATEPEQRFCTSCGVRVDPAWQFCADCGAKIDVGAESAG